MIVLGGFSRFPIFFDSSGKKNLGFKSIDEDLNEYVKDLDGKYVLLHSISELHYTSRFVIKKIAINPALKHEEDVPDYIYIPPDRNPEEIIKNAYSWGFILKGGRRTVYVPLICLRQLTRQEVDALLRIYKVKELDIKRLELFCEQLGIDIEVVKELAGNRIVLKMIDNLISDPYMVSIDKLGRVLDVNICIEMPEQLYLSELIMLIREAQGIEITSGFDY